MSYVLEIESLYGGYSPKKSIIENIHLQIKPGEMVGLIGLNGAGKSTTIKHILGLMKPQQGVIRVNGVTLHEDVEKYRGSYAYVPETPILFEEMTVEEHLKLTGMAYHLTESTFKERSQQLIQQFNMDAKRKTLSAHLSKGMKQKVMIMSALLANPSLFIIDEPFLGLDPLGIRSLLEQLVKVREQGAAILMSSHILSTIEMYCDKFLMLHQGNILAYGTLEEILDTARQQGSSATNLEEAFYDLVSGGAVK